MILQIAAHSRAFGDDFNAVARSSAPAPMPESCSSCGELMAPPQRITPLLACACERAPGVPISDADRAPLLEKNAQRLRMQP